MDLDTLRPTAFNGDPHVKELMAFFQPERQFAGDARWSFGTSLKSAFVNTFEFMNHAPVVQLWRDDTDEIQAVSRLSLGTGEWFYQAAPAYRTAAVAEPIINQADRAFRLLGGNQPWHTVCYQGNTEDAEVLERAGYEPIGPVEVYMTQRLDRSIETVDCPTKIMVRPLDQTNPSEVKQRAMAQVDAFTETEPTPAEVAWIGRTLPHQLSYGRPGFEPNIIAIDQDGSVHSFADVFFDRKNKIGEFEPVGTRKSARGLGLAKAATTFGLQQMQRAGMTTALVRTGVANQAAIATYQSVGFSIADHLIQFRKTR